MRDKLRCSILKMKTMCVLLMNYLSRWYKHIYLEYFVYLAAAHLLAKRQVDWVLWRKNRSSFNTKHKIIRRYSGDDNRNIDVL